MAKRTKRNRDRGRTLRVLLVGAVLLIVTGFVVLLFASNDDPAVDEVS